MPDPEDFEEWPSAWLLAAAIYLGIAALGIAALVVVRVLA